MRSVPPNGRAISAIAGLSRCLCWMSITSRSSMIASATISAITCSRLSHRCALRSGEAAFALAERLRMQVRACVPMIDQQRVDLSVSIGIAEAEPDMPDIHALLKRADRALYEAKRGGRNRVAIAG